MSEMVSKLAETSALEDERKTILKDLATRRAAYKRRSLFTDMVLEEHKADLIRFLERPCYAD